MLIRLATMQLTLKQVKSTRAMSTLQPKMKELQARYKNDRQKLSSETFKLYKEHGVNPIGCLGPLVIQFPIWIGLYWALIRVLPSSPENLADLSQLLYGWLPVVHSAVPVDSTFLWLDLAVPGHAAHHAVAGGRVHVGPAEDDDVPQPGPQAGADAADDAVDDAPALCVPDLQLSPADWRSTGWRPT